MNRSKYNTMVEATNDLLQKGYDQSFDYKDNKLTCLKTNKSYNAEDIVIDEQHRFEGMTNPADNSIVFAITCQDGTKGSVVSAYGPYANAKLMQFMDEIETNITQ